MSTVKAVLLILFLTACNSNANNSYKHVDVKPPVENTETLIDVELEAPCPNEMTYIYGNYCPKVKQECLDWIDDVTLPYARCRKYKEPSVCLTPRIAMSFCINTEELNDNFGVPYGNKSWTECKAICENRGAKLCNEEQWNFACEGEAMLPYPYGYEFSTTICNVEREHIVCGNKICDLRANISEYPKCISPFGIHNMVGNCDEWVITPLHYSSTVSGLSMRSGLKGGHFGGGRHRCRPMTADHSEHFRNDPTLGCRCCSDIK